MAPIISIQNLTKSYASGVQALQSTSLDIHKGEIFALLGPMVPARPRYKSTFVCGIVTPTSGDGPPTVTTFVPGLQGGPDGAIGLVPQN